MRDRTRWVTSPPLVLALAAAITFAAGVAGTSASRRISRPEGVPATPAGEQLAWVLAQLGGDAAAVQEADVRSRFSAEFFESVAPPPQIVELLRQTALEQGPLTFTGFAQPLRPDMVVALVRTREGKPAAVRVQVERGGAGRIVNLEVGDPPPAVPVDGPYSGTFDVGGRRVFLRCAGDGVPTVVLEGGTTADWLELQNRAATTTRVCSYDRATAPWSRSDPAPTPRSAGDMVADLRAVLEVAGVPAPYVLAGHSNGGLFVQLFASLHPDVVAGLVLIDAVHPDYHDRRQALLERFSSGAGEGAGGVPRRPTYLDAGQKILLAESIAQVRSAKERGGVPSVPMVVLTHGRPSPDDFPPRSPQQADEQLWRDLQADLATLGAGAEHVVVDGSGHDIPSERPDAVAAAIQRVVAAARAGGS